MSVRSISFVAGVALLLGFSGGAALAAPQVLGLVASNGVPTPLTCIGNECSAHFSAFCLQEHRPVPSHGHRYTVAPGATMTLVAVTADGRTLRLPGDALQFSSLIGFTSVKVSLPRQELADLGVTAVAVEVGPTVSLLPDSIAGDMQPQLPDEIATATGPMRLAAWHSFEQPGPSSDAARITSVLINALPADRPETAEQRDRLWLAQLSNPVVAAATPDGLAKAQSIYEGCKISVESKSIFALRNCLELRHADLQAESNHRFWRDTVGY